MKETYHNILDAIKYATSDFHIILIIGSILFLTSLINKWTDEFTFIKLSNILMVFVIGYGSYISLCTVKGQDKPPLFVNIKKLFWEGVKKLTIISIYSFFLSYFYDKATIYIHNNELLLFIATVIIFLVIWLLLIGGLINRFFNDGKFFSAFNLKEIVEFFLNCSLKRLLHLLIGVMISQLFALSVFVNFDKNLSVFEIFYSILTFFLAPYLFIATKRLIGLNIKELLDK